MHGRCCAALLLAVLAAPGAAAQPPLPPLPRLALDLFPPAAREPVSRVYRDATARADDPQAVGALGRALQAWEQWNAAHEAYTRARALAPRAFEWHYLDAMVLQRLARHGEAAGRLKDALRLSPDYTPARVKLADALFEAGDVEASRRLFDELARDAATEPMGRFGLGRIAAGEKQHAVAVGHLQRALELYPQWGAAHYALALSYRALGRREDAQRALERHAEYGPRWPALADPVMDAVATVRDDARAVLRRGIALADSGELAGAIEAHEKALAMDASLVQAHANLISLYGRVKEWAKAEAHYREVLRLSADPGDAHYDYGVLLALQQKWGDAADAYRKALEANPLHSGASNNLGEIHERERKFEDALRAYTRAVESRPLFRLARFNKGRMLLALGRTAEAIGELEQIVDARDAESPRYLFGLAAAYVRAGRKEEGIKWATEAKQLALQHGQNDLAAAIERDLSRLR